jgi:hypothetical protein
MICTKKKKTSSEYEYADVWNTISISSISHLGSSTLDERLATYRRQSALLDTECRALGRDPRTIRRTVFLSDPEMYVKYNGGPHPLYYYASVDAFEDVVTGYQVLGIDECIFYYPLVDDQLPVFRQIIGKSDPQGFH